MGGMRTQTGDAMGRHRASRRDHEPGCRL